MVMVVGAGQAEEFSCCCSPSGPRRGGGTELPDLSLALSGEAAEGTHPSGLHFQADRGAWFAVSLEVAACSGSFIYFLLLFLGLTGLRAPLN